MRYEQEHPERIYYKYHFDEPYQCLPTVRSGVRGRRRRDGGLDADAAEASTDPILEKVSTKTLA